MSTAESLGAGVLVEEEPALLQLTKKLLHVAWMGILLGIAIEVVLVAVALTFSEVKGARPFVADLVQKVSWSALVCVGMAFGKVISKTRVPGAGLGGLLAAPLAFNVARSLHKGVAQGLGLVATAPSVLVLLLISTLKGVEYGCLGSVVEWVQKRPWGGALAHAGVGLLMGVVFGAAIIAVMVRLAPGPIPPVELLSRAVNEVLFPVGCSFVLYAAEVLGKKLGAA
jgi:hypothetical protein